MPIRLIEQPSVNQRESVMQYMGVTYKHLRLFVEEQSEGWLAFVYDLDQIRFLHEGCLFHGTIEAAQKEAQNQTDLILGEATSIDWPRSLTACG
jgi:hypothetical protein